MQVNAVGSTTQGENAQVKSKFDQDTFMKILVAQLRYQNPMNPQQDSSQMIAQLTQFTILERLTNLGDQVEALVSTNMAGALSGMLGKEVSYLDDEGAVQSGKAEAVKFENGAQLLVIDGKDVWPEQITSITNKGDSDA